MRSFNRLFPWMLVLIGVACFTVWGCESGPVPKPEAAAGQDYGVTKGTFRGRWWNYYERGASYADGHFWKEAETDLRDALEGRSQDQRRARTYGMHFIDYFPHRELGVVLFHEGRYEEAIRELEASLQNEKSAKAEFYLDITRKSLIQQSKTDLRPPEIEIWSPIPGLLTNAFFLSVTGVVRDDTYVKTITVNGAPIRVDLAAPRVPFAMDMPLKPGENVIRVEAADLNEKRTVLERRLQVDRQGPILSIDEPVEGRALAGQGVRLRGYAYDDSGVTEILVNGHPISSSPTREFKLDYAIPSAAGLDRIVVQAMDLAGNQTTAEIRLSGGKAPPGEFSWHRLIFFSLLWSEMPRRSRIPSRQ